MSQRVSPVRRLSTVAFFVLWNILVVALPASANQAFYRIFLRDGSVIVSYGEFAHVADEIVASIPVGGTDANPLLHVLTIPQNDVDWERTNAYLHAARARRYADTRGELDFSLLTRDVADTLYQVGTTNDAARRLALAQDARKRLVEWAPQHYNYRAAELAQMTTWLDQVVSELRVAAGQSSFDLALVATPSPTSSATVELLPAPSARERVEFALVAARRSQDPVQRVSLLRAVLESLLHAPDDDGWAMAIRTGIIADLATEARIDRAYRAVTTKALDLSTAYQQKADVRALESVVAWVRDEDRKLNQARPATVAALFATLDVRLNTARRLRLARDAWVVRTAILSEYWRDVRKGLDRLLGIREWLTDVRQLAGPAPGSLRRLADDAAVAHRELAAVKAPPEVTAQHSTLIAAARMAVRAASARQEAVRSARMDVAWEASSAAAGALLVLDQAVEELQRMTRAPRPTSFECEKCDNCGSCR